MSMKRKVEIAEKVRIVQAYVKGSISREEAARQGRVVPDTIVGWARAYQCEGALGLAPDKNKVYSPELKKEAVEAYLAHGYSQNGVCEKYEIRSRTQLRDWIKEYNAHGDFNSVKHSGGGSYMKQGRDTTLEERIQIVKECIASGRNYGEMALKYNVSYQQARTWTLRYEEMGE